MPSLFELDGITDDDITKLRLQGITEIDSLWSRIGEDFDRGIDKLSGAALIDRNHLVDILAGEADREARETPGGKLKRIWPDTILILFALLLLVLALRALGGGRFLASPLGLRGSALIAVRNLEAGRVLRSSDLQTAPVSSDEGYFQATDQIEGLILSRPVLRHQPIRFGDVLRLQVVTEKDMPQESVISSDAVSLKWSNYQPDAALRLDVVVGHKALRAMRSGDVVVSQFVEPISP